MMFGACYPVSVSLNGGICAADNMLFYLSCCIKQSEVKTAQDSVLLFRTIRQKTGRQYAEKRTSGVVFSGIQSRRVWVPTLSVCVSSVYGNKSVRPDVASKMFWSTRVVLSHHSMSHLFQGIFAKLVSTSSTGLIGGAGHYLGAGLGTGGYGAGNVGRYGAGNVGRWHVTWEQVEMPTVELHHLWLKASHDLPPGLGQGAYLGGAAGKLGGTVSSFCVVLDSVKGRFSHISPFFTMSKRSLT